MQLTTIDMPADEARHRLDDYQARLATERTRQDEQIAAGYRALARGLSVIRLSETVGRGGFFDNGLPRIAVARADSQDCWVHRDSRHELVFSSTEPGWGGPRNRGALVNDTTVRVSVPEAPEIDWRSRQGHTIMPLIPPQHRPRANRLHRFHILWEVEAWELVPPRDPALLRWIGGDLWAVVAVWDLSELERAVLAR